jgi:hypothetical protein
MITQAVKANFASAAGALTLIMPIWVSGRQASVL